MFYRVSSIVRAQTIVTGLISYTWGDSDFIAPSWRYTGCFMLTPLTSVSLSIKQKTMTSPRSQLAVTQVLR